MTDDAKTERQKELEKVRETQAEVSKKVEGLDDLDPTPVTEPGSGEKKYDGGEIPRGTK